MRTVCLVPPFLQRPCRCLGQQECHEPQKLYCNVGCAD